MRWWSNCCGSLLPLLAFVQERAPCSEHGRLVFPHLGRAAASALPACDTAGFKELKNWDPLEREDALFFWTTSHVGKHLDIKGGHTRLRLLRGDNKHFQVRSEYISLRRTAAGGAENTKLLPCGGAAVLPSQTAR